ncbi:hypothetical protein P280DRAFT_516067 [Massarina eburnea CBS 473.64]|uniref:Uncharacterized protein n=1 Tax=Massarina eburnea CBS 473.64 TaxID=1395130 RepID=A0A6A6S3X2_9PLEO|nr:hypothetical protein P280DRAFT_516067 [Massarina eburnea CBS 473.64]
MPAAQIKPEQEPAHQVPAMDTNNSRHTPLPSIHEVLHQQSLRHDEDQMRRLSLGSSQNTSSEEEGYVVVTLPPLNFPSPNSRQTIVARRLEQVQNHLPRYEPYPSLGLGTPPETPEMTTRDIVYPIRTKTGRRSTRSGSYKPYHDSETDQHTPKTRKAKGKRNPKARREAGARLGHGIAFADLSYVQRLQNPNLVNEWTPLKKNNVINVEDALAHNKIDVLESAVWTIQDWGQIGQICLQSLLSRGEVEEARAIAEKMKNVGSRYEKRPPLKMRHTPADHRPKRTQGARL